ncbi:MAG: hypothetical protein J3K34DRAFT_182045 [Monoraphidium minutum]|nr:MAG: hypothetical protein J3K34DRAFT_182045 [Monoraphidium minutum]
MAGSGPQLLREDVLEPVIAVLSRQAAGSDGKDAARDAAEARRALRATCNRCCAAVDATCGMLHFRGSGVCSKMEDAAVRRERRPHVRRVLIEATSRQSGYCGPVETPTRAADVAEAYCAKLEALEVDLSCDYKESFYNPGAPLLSRLGRLAAAERLPRLTTLALAADRLSVSGGAAVPPLAALTALTALSSLSLRGRIIAGARGSTTL